MVLSQTSYFLFRDSKQIGVALMKSTELREKRAAIAAQARKLLDSAEAEKRAMTAEENEQWDRMHADVDSLKGEIDRLEKQESLEASLSEVRNSAKIGREDRMVAAPSKADFHKELWNQFVKYGVREMSREQENELRALSVGTASAGGYSAPAYFATEFIDAVRDFSPLLQAPVYQFATVGGNDLPFPTTDDTANSGATTAEATALADDVDVTFGSKTMKAYNVDSNILIVSKQFLQDTMIPAEQFINAKLAERIAVKLNNKYTVGAGSTTWQGIVTGASTSGVTLPVGTLGASTSAIIDNLIDIQHSVKAAFRNKPTCGWMFNDTLVAALKKVKDSTGRQIWTPGLTQGAPDRLLDKPYWINSDMASIGASAKSILFGDFSQFYVRNVGSVELIRLDERYAEKRQVGFLGHFRSDSMVMDSSAIKYAAHAAS